MPSGLPNGEKARVRQLYAEGKVGREELLDAEAASYHGSRHLHLLRHRQLQPAADGGDGPAPARRRASSTPGTPLRDRADRRGRPAGHRDHRARRRLHPGRRDRSTSARSSTACVALLATGGSTNHTMHLVAIARAAGITLTWDDIADLSAVVPLLARIYPNGSADVNHFHAAGGHRRSLIARAARRRPAARGRADRRRAADCARYTQRAQARRGRRDAGCDGTDDEPRHSGAAPGRRSVRRRRRPAKCSPATSARAVIKISAVERRSTA